MKRLSAVILSLILCAMSVVPVLADDAAKVITFPGQEGGQTVTQPAAEQPAQTPAARVPYLALGADLSPEQLATVLKQYIDPQDRRSFKLDRDLYADGESISSWADFNNALAQHLPGECIELTLYRDGKIIKAILPVCGR